MQGDESRSLGEGRYQLEQIIEETETTRTWLAWDVEIDAYREVRALTAAARQDPFEVEAFMAQVQVAMRLESPHLVRSLSIATEEAMFEVREHSEGGSAARWLEAHGPMPLRMAADVAEQAALALSDAHEGGAAWDSGGPASVWIDRQGVIKLTGLGSTDDPERRSLDTLHVAMLLYTLATGHTPAGAETVATTDLPDVLGEIVARALGVEPPSYGGMAELAEAISVAKLLQEPLPATAVQITANVPGGLRKAAPQGPTSPRTYGTGYLRGVPTALEMAAKERTPPPAPRAEIEEIEEEPAQRPTGTPIPVSYRMGRVQRSQREMIADKLRARDPRAAGEEEESLPSWAEPTPGPAPERDYTITPSLAPRTEEPDHDDAAVGQSTAATPGAALPRVVTPGASPPRTPAPLDPLDGVKDATDVPDADDQGDGSLTVGGVPIVAFVLGLAIVGVFFAAAFILFVGVTGIKRTAAGVERSGAELVTAVEKNAVLVMDLKKLDVEARDVDVALEAFHSAPPHQRVETALAVVEAASAVEKPTGDSPVVHAATQRIGRMGGAAERYREAATMYEGAASTLVGKVTLGLGLAAEPSTDDWR